MKTIGIIGGLSPQSTIKYYEWLNKGVRERLGGAHTAKIILSAVDFGLFCELKEKGDWAVLGEMLAQEARALELAGADFIILATNTMHKVANKIEAAISIPFLHLADVTASRIKEAGISSVGLLGTHYTMEMDFYKASLKKAGIDTLIPNEKDRKIVNDIIYNELCNGVVTVEAKEKYIEIIEKLAQSGVQSVILGCTEITMLIKNEDVSIPVFDTIRIHVDETLKLAFE